MSGRYRLAAVDLDGTLLGSDKTVSAGNRAAIAAARAAGLDVIVATGRSLHEAANFAREAGCGSDMICEGGTMVADAYTHAVLHIWTMQAKDAAALIRTARSFGLTAMCYVDGDTWLTPDAEGVIFKGANRYRADLSHYRIHPALEADLEARGGTVTKLLACGDPQAVQAARAALPDLPGVRVTSSGTDNFEAHAAGAGKGTALKWLCRHRGIPLAQTIAMGDAENDLDLLKAAGAAVAMGDGAACVREIADFLAPGHNADGVAAALRHFNSMK